MRLLRKATPSQRIGAPQTNGYFLIKLGALNTSWYDVLDNVSAGALNE